MTLAEANTLVDLILEAHRPSTASWGARVLEYGRAERSGSPERLARALAELYAEPSLTPAQQLMLLRLEDRLLPDLADALGEPVARLRARLHGDRKIFEGDAPGEPAQPERPAALRDVQAPAAWGLLHTFRVSGGALVIGSSPEDVESSLTLPAADGEWRVFTAPMARRGLFSVFRRPQTVLVVVHAPSVAAAPRALAAARPIERTDGRFTTVIDAAARRDARIKRLTENVEATARSYTFTSESSSHEWRGWRGDAGQLELLATELDDD